MNNFKKYLQNERGGASDMVGFIAIILVFVIIPFMFSLQIFQYYYVQSIVYNAAGSTMRFAEIGIDSYTIVSSNGDYPAAQKIQAKDYFIENLRLQGIEINKDFNMNDVDFKLETKEHTPFVRLEIKGTVPVQYARNIIGSSSLPVNVILYGRKHITK